jgi:hypothetical protein
MEVLISLAVIIIGLLGLTRVASVAVQTNTRGLRMATAADKARARLEALRNVPTATLACLASGSDPSSCLSSCVGGGGEQYACQTALGLAPGDQTDAMNTQYNYGFLVQMVTSNIYDIQVVVTFNDDTVDQPRTVRAMYRTAVYRGS